MKKLIVYTPLGVISIGFLGRMAIAYLLPDAKVTSWWRSWWHNQEVGGVSNSRHLVGLAYDITPVTDSNINTLKSAFPGANVINEGTHIHVELV